MRQALEAFSIERPVPTAEAPQHLCLDKGYDYAEPREIATAFGFTPFLRTRSEGVEARRHVGARARRWVVKRAHSSMNRFRALLIRWSKRPEN